MAGKDYTGGSSSAGIIDLGGGLNTSASALRLEDNELSDLLNVDFTIYGSIKGRSGYLNLNDTPVASGAACSGLYNYKIDSTGTEYLMGVFGDKLFSMDDLDGTFDEVTISGTTITADASIKFDFEVLDELLVMTNGEDAPIKWTGTGAAEKADVPTDLSKAKYLAVWNNFMFYGNVTVGAAVHKSRIYWSNLKDPTTWTASDWIDVSKNDGQEIRGVEPLGDRLVIFKDRSVYNLFYTGDADIPFILTKSQSSVGGLSGYLLIDNGIAFLSQSGIYYYDGNNSIKISDKITPTLAGFAKNRFQYSVAGYRDSVNTAWWAFSTTGGTENNRIVTWNTVKNSFSVYSGIAANVITTFTVNNDERLYFGDYSGYVYRADYGTNDYPLGVATAINKYFYTKWYNFGNIMEKKGVPHIRLFYQVASSTIAIGYGYDLESSDQFSQNIYIGTSGDVYGSATYGVSHYATAGGAVKRIDLTGRGVLMRLHISNNTLDETFQIDGIGFYPHLETVS